MHPIPFPDLKSPLDLGFRGGVLQYTTSTHGLALFGSKISGPNLVRTILTEIYDGRLKQLDR